MDCNSKIKNTCTSKNYAVCINYESNTNTQSELNDEDCLNIEETTSDIYNQLQGIREELDISIGDSCIDYEKQDEKVKLSEFITKIGSKVCDLEDRLTVLEQKNICDYPIDDCNFNLGSLVDDCGEQPQTMGELLQILINQHNN